MTKSLMVSIQPQHAVNILNGKKTLELRTWIPKGYVGWVYVFVTKGKKDILYKYKDKYYTQHYLTFTDSVEVLNSKVAFRFWFDEYIKLEWVDMTLNHNPIDRIYNYHALVKNVYNNVEWILPKLCLTKQQVIDYGKERDLYAWHIKKLEVFDEPKELSEFYRLNCPHYMWFINEDEFIPLKKAPQRSVWVYTKEVWSMRKTDEISLTKFLETEEGNKLWNSQEVKLVLEKETVFILKMNHYVGLDKLKLIKQSEFTKQVDKYVVEDFLTIDEVNYIFIKEKNEEDYYEIK